MKPGHLGPESSFTQREEIRFKRKTNPSLKKRPHLFHFLFSPPKKELICFTFRFRPHLKTLVVQFRTYN